MGQVRTRTVHGSVAALAAVVLVMLAACTPPVTPPPAPTLPTGTGVAWWKDAGGTIVEDFGGPTYRPAFQRWVTLGGTATGPGPVDAGAALPAPYLAAFGFNLPMYPDGTAKYPWNGFAGEGISAATNPNSIVVAFPGGTCTIGASLGVQVGGITPSPDGTKLAYVGRDISGFFGYTVAWVDILSLHPGGGCSAFTILTVDYIP